jgi:hypothetical protein
MKKLILIMTLIAVSLSSCLKDKTYLDFPNAGNIVNFPLSGTATFDNDNITQDRDTVKFAVDYATSKANPALSVTLAVDTTLIAPYNAANAGSNGFSFVAIPASAYVFTGTTVAIPAGAQYAFTTIVINRYLLDPTKNYMLPVKIASASGVKISANQSVHYYHVYGNDFGGTYKHDFTSTPAVGNFVGQATKANPLNAGQFEFTSGYMGIRYEVTFSQTGTGANATYSGFAVSLNSDDVTNDLSNASPVLTVSAGATFVKTPPDGVTKAQALTYFNFTYGVVTAAGVNSVYTDKYYQ